MHGLNRRFFDDLDEGLLTPIRDRVIDDRTLCLEIRKDYVNVYYRGGNLLMINATDSGYLASFNVRYAKGDGGVLSRVLPTGEMQTSDDVAEWLSVIPRLKLAIDLHMGARPKEEREAQQIILRENNFGGVSRATDYYICDIEYQHPHGRIDMVGVHWPSTPVERKRNRDRRMVLFEVKYGDSALEGDSGIHAHITHMNRFLSCAASLESLKNEMVRVFNQKRALGLTNCGKDLESFSDEPPVVLLLLVNHDPGKSCLRTVLGSLPTCPNAEVHLATGCMMGYGLFDQAVVPLEEALSRFRTCI